MKILKSRISKSVLIAAYYITLVVIFRTPVLSDLSIETIKTNLFDVSTLVPVFLVGVSYVILSQLYLSNIPYNPAARPSTNNPTPPSAPAKRRLLTVADLLIVLGCLC